MQKVQVLLGQVKDRLSKKTPRTMEYWARMKGVPFGPQPPEKFSEPKQAPRKL